jgi:excinuclease ABC subunit A
VGVPTCPDCGEPLARYSLDQIVDLILRDYPEKKIEILSPVVRSRKESTATSSSRSPERLPRARVDSVVYWLEEEISLEKNKKHVVEIVVDRLTARADKRDRLAEAVETALAESAGFVLLVIEGGEERLSRRTTCAPTATRPPRDRPAAFLLQQPYGACPACMGLGSHEFFPPELAVVPNRSIAEGALLPWNGPQHYMLRAWDTSPRPWGGILPAPSRNFPRDPHLHPPGTPRQSPHDLQRVRRGAAVLGRYEGLLPWLERRGRRPSPTRSRKNSPVPLRENLRRLRRPAPPPRGLAIKVGPYGIGDMVRMPVSHLYGPSRTRPSRTPAP